MIEDIIIFGAISGGVYALLALGFTLIYGVTNVVNMAHGAFFMFGAYIFHVLTTPTLILFGRSFEPIQLDLRLALILAIILTGILGCIVYRLTINPVLEDEIAVLVVTVGASLIFRESMIIGLRAGRKSVVSFTSELCSSLGIPEYAYILDVKVTYDVLLAFAFSLVLFTALWIFVTKSKIGKAMRAVAQDREVAMLMGVNTERLYMLTMAISASLAATAGILITAGGFAHPDMWRSPLFTSFAIVILGGLGSIKGTLIGAFIVGYAAETFGRLYPEVGFLRDAVALAIMMLVILLRPKGLFGKRIELEE